MKNYFIECDFEFHSSHDISELGFEGSSSYNLKSAASCSCPLGLPNTKIKIIGYNEPTFKVIIDTFDLVDQHSKIVYLNKLANYLSFLSAKSEKNGHYGTPFIKVIYSSFKEDSINAKSHVLKDSTTALSSLLKVTDAVSIGITRTIEFDDNIEEIHYSELLEYYYSGLKAESEKSKFFHWFLIIEYLEGCELYKELFPLGTMFTDNEKKEIKLLANKFSNESKNALLSVLPRTSEFRNPKLLKLLHALGIKQLTTMAGSEPMTIDTVKAITHARNKLFHKGAEFPTNTLWHVLFPLVTQIIEKIVFDPTCLNAANKLLKSDG